MLINTLTRSGFEIDLHPNSVCRMQESMQHFMPFLIGNMRTLLVANSTGIWHATNRSVADEVLFPMARSIVKDSVPAWIGMGWIHGSCFVNVILSLEPFIVLLSDGVDFPLPANENAGPLNRF